MGLDAGISRIKCKANNNKELKKIKNKYYRLSLEEYNRLEDSTVYYTDFWLIDSYFMRNLNGANKTDFENGEYLIIKQQELQRIIKKLRKQLYTYKGWCEIINPIRNEYNIKSLKPFNNKWWRNNVLKPLEKILKETNFQNETLYYEESY